MEHIYQTIPGWCSIEQRDFYMKMVREATSDKKHFVEVGSWLGQSASVMGVEIENSGKDIQFDAVDTWEGSVEHSSIENVVNKTLYEDFLKNIEPIKHRINPVRGKSVDVAKQYEDASLDFVFIDAGHSYEDVFSDIAAWLPKIKAGGIIGGDDFDSVEFPGVVLAVEHILKRYRTLSIIGRVWWCTLPQEIEILRNIDKQIPENTVVPITVKFDEYLNLNNNYDREIYGTYILTIKDNERAAKGLVRCIASCEKVGQKNIIPFYGYDGTDRETIKTPDHLKNADYMKWFKLVDHGLSITEVACALGHLALWAECMRLDKPIVVLEHDAIMFQNYDRFKFYNAIEYLGHSIEMEQIKQMFGVKTLSEITDKVIEHKVVARPNIRNPVPNIINQNYIFPMGFHAYAIDPMMARRLFMKVLGDGLTNPIDTVAEIGEFEIVQTEIYACDGDDAVELSTINERSDEENKNDILGGRKYTYDIPGVSP
jgi:predicted O-methyltransferase YrrM/GR25 family glycosyltransferase involved in LPS biosynthesis